MTAPPDNFLFFFLFFLFLPDIATKKKDFARVWELDAVCRP